MEIEELLKEATTLRTELKCFQELHCQEQIAAPRRIEALQEKVIQMNDCEYALQSQFEILLVELDSLKGLIRKCDDATASSMDLQKHLRWEEPLRAGIWGRKENFCRCFGSDSTGEMGLLHGEGAIVAPEEVSHKAGYQTLV
jgi:hypothetical protein